METQRESDVSIPDQPTLRVKWTYVPCRVPTSGPSSWCSAALRWLRAMDPGGHSLGCHNCRRVSGGDGEWSLHACGRAIDWVPSSFAAGQALNHAIVDSGSLDVQLVIWNRQQWGGRRGPVFSAYPGKDPHTTHLHIESRNATPA